MPIRTRDRGTNPAGGLIFRMLSLLLRITAVATLVIACVALMSSPRPAVASQPYPFEGARKHLYVGVDGGTVLLLPFLPNGLPSVTPEAILNVGSSPFGLAFDSHNDLYVSSPNSGQVRIFAPGPHGATQLIHIFDFGTYVASLAVGPDDYVYVVVDPNSGGSSVKIYPPGIGDPSQPVAQIFTSNFFGDIALDRTGALYVRTFSNILVYSHPRLSQALDGMFAPPGGYWMYDGYGSTAVDRDNQLLFVVHTLRLPNRWGNADFAVRDLTENVLSDRVILTSDCTGQYGYPGFGDGAAVREPYLFYACDNQILVYRADVFGKQRAVTKLSGGPIETPLNVIVGT